MDLNKDITPEISLHLKISGGKLIAEADADLAAVLVKLEAKQANPIVKAIMSFAEIFVKTI